MEIKKVDQGHSVIEFSEIDLCADGNSQLQIDETDGDGTTSVFLEADAATECIWQSMLFLFEHHRDHYNKFVEDIATKAFGLGVRVPRKARFSIPCVKCKVVAEFDFAWAIENGYATGTKSFLCDMCTPAKPWPAKKEGA